MRRTACFQPVLVCACLAAGLLFDPLGFLRMALVCSAVHEAGHMAACLLCVHRLPRVVPGVGGLSLSLNVPLSRAQELAVLCAGPSANFLFAAALYCAALYRARYGLYFMAAVSLCTGLYNLLPLGVLDGARLLQNVLAPHRLGALYRAQQALLALGVCAALCMALCAPLPAAARIAAALAPGYLLLQQFFA